MAFADLIYNFRSLYLQTLTIHLQTHTAHIESKNVSLIKSRIRGKTANFIFQDYVLRGMYLYLSTSTGLSILA